MSHVSAGSHCLLRQASWTSKDNKSLYVILAVMRNINKTVTFVQTPTLCRASIADMYGYAYNAIAPQRTSSVESPVTQQTQL